MTCCVPAAAAALFVVIPTGIARAQSMDVVPAYHPDGPGAGYAEVFKGDEVTFELSLPGMNHQESQAASSTWLAFLLASFSTSEIH